MSNTPVSLFWFRRDLRLHDNNALFDALRSGRDVLPVFIFDEDIISDLPVDDHRVDFIYEALRMLDTRLRTFGSGLLVIKGKPLNVFRQLLTEYHIEAVYANRDHESYGQLRDEKIRALLDASGIAFHTRLDHLILGRDDVLKADGSPYMVFTPYSRRWRERIADRHLKSSHSENYPDKFLRFEAAPFPSRKALGFKSSGMRLPALQADIPESLIKDYDKNRDFPALDATSRLGPHLRFGLVSVRELFKKAASLNDTYVSELIWREFYAMVLWHFPGVATSAFKPEYDRIVWREAPQEFERWKKGLTGYPMVDAGMRQLDQTGFMHNRLRMITASFLSKHLLIDWRLGEAWFASRLFDFELSSNNGGWQWSAGTGVDAAPYFRIFNPDSQQKKFDPDLAFVRKWIPEFGTQQYPLPIVDHAFARERCLKAFQLALKN